MRHARDARVYGSKSVPSGTIPAHTGRTRAMSDYRKPHTRFERNLQPLAYARVV